MYGAQGRDPGVHNSITALSGDLKKLSKSFDKLFKILLRLGLDSSCEGDDDL